MRRTGILWAILCLIASAGWAETVAERAARASADLTLSIAAMESATSARDQVTALSQTIRAYELGLDALREALRQASIREAALDLEYAAKRDKVEQLVGVLTQMEADPGPLLLMHPSGALGTVRSGMILAEVTPALQAEAELIRADLTELRQLRDLQLAANDRLSAGLRVVQSARTALSKTISERADPPTRFTDDPNALLGLVESSDTLDAFAAGLAPISDTSGSIRSFEAAKGTLPMPVLGQIIRRANEADAAGTRRPGIAVAARPLSIVTSPWPATIRYSGLLLDYGNVMIIDPGAGYLLVLAGMQTMYGELGEIVAAGAPLGLMGGADPDMTEFLVSDQEGGGAQATETLYMELRQGATPVDPADWFTGVGR
jgi:septal ring factor EnvC (AmiA/AmiB activator)